MKIAQEDYLKAILSFELDGEHATVSILADRLAIKPSSVTEMVKKLSARDYLIHQNYKGFQLTARGRSVALRVLRRHRLWETFLHRILHYSWSELHEEAEMFEHLISERMEAKIDQLLDFPQVDPHGHPIPSAEGILPYPEARRHWLALSTLQKGQVALVIQVRDHHPSFLIYLEKINLHLNNRVTVHNVLEFDQSVEIEFNERTLLLSRQMAQNILVQIIDTEERVNKS